MTLMMSHDSPGVSVVLPTNRSLALSRASIESALSFCKTNGFELVVSDNSRSAEKLNFLREACIDFAKVYVGPDSANDNWEYALQRASGDYVLFLSDDDLIFSLGKITWSFSQLSGVVGIRPHIAGWTPNSGLLYSSGYEIIGSNALERVTNHFRSIGKSGNNTLFSFWKRDALAEVLNFLRYCPLRGGHNDWALVLTLVSIGSVRYEPRALLCYNRSNWSTESEKKTSNKKIANEIGIKDGCGYVLPLLVGLDCYILMNKRSAPPDASRHDASLRVLQFFLSRFVNEASSASANEPMCRLLDLLRGPVNMSKLFSEIERMLEFIKPGAGGAYKEFFLKVTGSCWPGALTQRP